jgi:hypothetical protein
VPLKKSLIIILICATFFSCKKKEEAPPTIIQNTTTGSTPTATVGTPATFSALCSNQKILLIYNNFTNIGYTVQNNAVFSSSVFTNFSLPTNVLNAGAVNLNGKVFKNTVFNYNDTTNTYQTGPMVWSVTGSVIPTFTYTNNNPYPTYADYTSWPDTIQKNQSYKIFMKSIFNADEAELIIANAGNYNASTYTAMVASGYYRCYSV